MQSIQIEGQSPPVRGCISTPAWPERGIPRQCLYGSPKKVTSSPRPGVLVQHLMPGLLSVRFLDILEALELVTRFQGLF